MERVKVPARDTGEVCPQCGEGTLVIREGKFGEFTGCSRYPECDYIKDRKAAAEPTGEACPQCGKPLVLRQGRRGPFVGCSGYPTCRYIKGDAPAPAPRLTPPAPAEELGACPECGKPLARRSGRRGSFVGCTGYPSCKYIQPGSNQAGGAPPAAAEPTGEACPDCGKPLVKRQGRYGPFVSCSGYPGLQVPATRKARRSGEGGRHVSGIHATTIVAVKRGGRWPIAGDGQVTVGDVVMKHRAVKVRRLFKEPRRGRFRGRRRRRLHALRQVRAAPREAPGQPAPRRRRAGQGVAHRQVPASPRGHADRGRPGAAPAAQWRGRDHRARRGHHRHRQRWSVRARRRARAGGEHGSSRRRGGAQGAGDRSPAVHLHQRHISVETLATRPVAAA